MGDLAKIKIGVERCGELLARFYFNGWHYISLKTDVSEPTVSGQDFNPEVGTKIRAVVESVSEANLNGVLAMVRASSIELKFSSGWRRATLEAGELAYYETTQNYYDVYITSTVWGII